MSPCGRACKMALPRLAGQGRHIVFTLPQSLILSQAAWRANFQGIALDLCKRLSVALAFAGGSCAQRRADVTNSKWKSKGYNLQLRPDGLVIERLVFEVRCTYASKSKKRRKKVNNNCSKKHWGGSATQIIVRGSLAALAMISVSGMASAQERAQGNQGKITSPNTPAAITPPAGNSAFFVGHAVGTQGYICLPTSTGASWTVNGARPEATLFTNILGEAVQIITHFLSPNANPNGFAPTPIPFANATWQSSFDSSKVWGQPIHDIRAGSDPSCPNAGSIPCVLLQVIGSEPGPAGGKLLAKTTFIQRLNTNGGSAPATGCLSSGDVANQVLVPYSADYFFFRTHQ